jgi:dihydroorotate dehydrogenase
MYGAIRELSPIRFLCMELIKRRDSFAIIFVTVRTLAPSSPENYKTLFIFRRSTFTRKTLLQKAMLNSMKINNIITEAFVDRLLTHTEDVNQVPFIYPKKEI